MIAAGILVLAVAGIVLVVKAWARRPPAGTPPVRQLISENRGGRPMNGLPPRFS